MEDLFKALFVIFIGLFIVALVLAVIVALIPIALLCALFALIGTPGGLIGVLVSGWISRLRGRSVANRLFKRNPLGSIVRFGYTENHKSITWELNEAGLSDYNSDRWFEILRWLAGSLSAVLIQVCILLFLSQEALTWKGPIWSSMSAQGWRILGWVGFIVGLLAIGYILKKFLPKQRTSYSNAIKRAGEGLINRNVPVLHELSGLYTQAWEATEGAAIQIGMTDSVTLLASIEQSWDALRSQNLLSLLQAEDWSSFRTVCDGIKADGIRLNDLASRYLRGEPVPEDEQHQESRIMTYEDALETLGLEEGCNRDDVVRAYKKIIKEVHVDHKQSLPPVVFKALEELCAKLGAAKLILEHKL